MSSSCAVRARYSSSGEQNSMMGRGNLPRRIASIAALRVVKCSLPLEARGARDLVPEKQNKIININDSCRLI